MRQCSKPKSSNSKEFFFVAFLRGRKYDRRGRKNKNRKGGHIDFFLFPQIKRTHPFVRSFGD